jgi:hypothetical protein
MDLTNLIRAYHDSDRTSFNNCCKILEEPFRRHLLTAVESECSLPQDTSTVSGTPNLVMLRIQTARVINIVKPLWEQANDFKGYENAEDHVLEYKRDHLNQKQLMANKMLENNAPTLLGEGVPHGLSEEQQKRYNLYLFFLPKAYIDPRDCVRCLWFKTCANHQWAVCAQLIICSSAGARAIADNFVLGAYRANAMDAAGINKNVFRGLSMNLAEYEGYDERTARKYWMDYVVDGTVFPGSSELEGIRKKQIESLAEAPNHNKVLPLSSGSIHHTHIHCSRRQ